MMKRIARFIAVITLVLAPMGVRAGDLDPPAGPEGGSGMYTLEEIFDYLIYGVEAYPHSGFLEPLQAPGATGRTLAEIYDNVKSKFEQSTAGPGHVLATVKFFSTDPAQWGPQSGTIQTRALSGSSLTVEAGYYPATTLDSVDPDLTSANIRKGQAIFGVSGDPDVVDTSSGTAGTSDILSGKKAWVDGAEITGTISSGGNVLGSEGSKTITIPQGYYTGSQTATARDADLIPDNIRLGLNVFGVVGTADVLDTSSGTAGPGDILSGKKAWVDGAEITGTIPNGSNVLGSEGSLATSIPLGYYSGGQTATARDADLVTGNVKKGITIFGVSGDPNVVDTSSGTAGSGDILSGEKAWVDGAEITGTIPNGSNVLGSEGSLATSIPQGYYSGSQTATAQDADLVTGNVKKGITIFGVSGDPNVVDTSSGTAGTGDILSGEKAWVDGAEITGTMAIRGNITGSEGSKTIAIPQGYYSGSQTATAQDADLVTGNVKKGITIFGVSGDPNVVDTSSGTAGTSDILSGEKAWVDGAEITGARAPSPASKTGQTVSHHANDDGDLQPGQAWPSPRFTKNADYDGDGECSDSGSCDGSITDNLTGLIWLQNAGCLKFFGTDNNNANERNWEDALTAASSLASGYCGLSDGSAAGDWHLPTVKELASLTDFGQDTPAIMSGHPFLDAQSWYYWTSTTDNSDSSIAWRVDFISGGLVTGLKTTEINVWPVR